MSVSVAVGNPPNWNLGQTSTVPWTLKRQPQSSPPPGSLLARALGEPPSPIGCFGSTASSKRCPFPVAMTLCRHGPATAEDAELPELRSRDCGAGMAVVSQPKVELLLDTELPHTHPPRKQAS